MSSQLLLKLPAPFFLLIKRSRTLRVNSNKLRLRKDLLATTLRDLDLKWAEVSEAVEADEPYSVLYCE
jgi:hypothetical protein